MIFCTMDYIFFTHKADFLLTSLHCCYSVSKTIGLKMEPEFVSDRLNCFSLKKQSYRLRNGATFCLK